MVRTGMKLPLFVLAASVPLSAGAGAPADQPSAAPALSPTGASRNVKATLLSEVDSIRPGQTFWLGLKLEMSEGWHVYWKQAGDAGLPPKLKWTLPAGYQAGAIAWPYPVRFDAGGITSYGYREQVLLLVPVTAPATAAAGSTVPLAAAASWLECREVCLPGKAALGLTLPVKAGAAVRNPATSGLFKETRANLPRAARGWTFADAGDHLVLEAPATWRAPAAPVEFFAANDNVILYAAPQTAKAGPGPFRLELKRDPNGSLPASLSGVLVAGRGAAVEALDIHATRKTDKTGGPGGQAAKPR